MIRRMQFKLRLHPEDLDMTTMNTILEACKALVPQPLRHAMRRNLWASRWGYSLYMRKDLLQGGVAIVSPKGRPAAPWQNAVLQSIAEAGAATAQAEALGLPGHDTATKNWDCLSALDTILSNTSKDAKILDAGAEVYSVIAPWLASYGYTDLTAINLTFRDKFKQGPIAYEYGDVTGTAYPAETFDAITSISVIEHGVDTARYFAEMARILKPGGLLITSTDYWETPIDTTGMSFFGAPVRVFTRPEIEELIEVARANGLILTGGIDLSCGERAVTWDDLNLHYTFVVLTMRKAG